ncbi:hypothetical protein TNCV_3778111 [Trichonephila clavipes]|nr:hypothetical protein TNCV_3778111 [Trichonephila clavipes]
MQPRGYGDGCVGGVSWVRAPVPRKPYLAEGLMHATSVEAQSPHVGVMGYTRAFGDGPRNFESWSSDVDDT